MKLLRLPMFITLLMAGVLSIMQGAPLDAVMFSGVAFILTELK